MFICFNISLFKGLYGSNEIERTNIDMVLEILKDLLDSFVGIIFEKDAAAKVFHIPVIQPQCI